MKDSSWYRTLMMTSIASVVAVFGSSAIAAQNVPLAVLQDIPMTRLEAAMRDVRAHVWITDTYQLPSVAGGEIELFAVVVTWPGSNDKVKGVRMVVREEVDHRPTTHVAFLDVDELKPLSDALATMMKTVEEKPPSEVQSFRSMTYIGRGDVAIGCSQRSMSVTIGTLGVTPQARLVLPMTNLLVMKASIDRGAEILGSR